MPRIQLIIEAESAFQMASVISQMAARYKTESASSQEAPQTASASTPKPNGSDTPELTVPYEAPAQTDKAEFPSETETSAAPAPKAADAAPAFAPKRSHKKKTEPEPPAQPEEAPEAAPDELPSLDDLKSAITKAVVAEPHGGPIRTALETLRPTLNIALIRNAKEEHRPALWTFVQAHGIALPAQV